MWHAEKGKDGGCRGRAARAGQDRTGLGVGEQGRAGQDGEGLYRPRRADQSGVEQGMGVRVVVCGATWNELIKLRGEEDEVWTRGTCGMG